jgi:V8-like Glu-specific endopeptidase
MTSRPTWRVARAAGREYGRAVDEDVPEPRKTRGLRKGVMLEASASPPETEVLLGRFQIPEAARLEVVEDGPDVRVAARLPGEALGVRTDPGRVPVVRVGESEIAEIDGRDVPADGQRPEYLAVTRRPEELKLRRRRKPRGDVGIGAAVFPPDGRYLYADTRFPWCTVGRVDTPILYGSGVMIGARLMLTAGHLIDWGRDGGDAGWVRFRPSYVQGSAPFGEAWATHIVYWRENDNWLTDDETAFDYVVCVLDRRLGGVVGYAGYRTYRDRWNSGRYWQNLGYPTDIGTGERPAFQTDGTIESVGQFALSGQTGFVLGSFDDLMPGHSGGPVWGWWGEEPWPRVVGVFSTLPVTPAKTSPGDNEYAGGPAMSSLIAWARTNFP